MFFFFPTRPRRLPYLPFFSCCRCCATSECEWLALALADRALSTRRLFFLSSRRKKTSFNHTKTLSLNSLSSQCLERLHNAPQLGFIRGKRFGGGGHKQGKHFSTL